MNNVIDFRSVSIVLVGSIWYDNMFEIGVIRLGDIFEIVLGYKIYEIGGECY